MKDKIVALEREIIEETIKTTDEQEQFRVRYLGSKNIIKELFLEIKSVPNEEKKEVGKLLNNLKQIAQSKHDSFTPEPIKKSKDQTLDKSRPAEESLVGSRHPLSLIRSEIIEIFSRVGFVVSEGPEIEDDWHNFSALNFPPEHPARDMQDTFFIKKSDKERSLRTHTSSVQVRVMEHESPPIRTISPGRVYRNEAISPRAHCFFHQVEGLYIDEDVSFADLKQTILYFVREMFGEKTKIRLRPSYFPFTEPSAEVDIYWGLKTESDYRITKGTGWLEILGCGMVDPNVLQNSNIDPKKYSGYAFGMGIERIAMLKYGVNDLRLFFENDIRFLNQFTSGI